jgi:outer membrane scaffolding protein for murein synthesis (MipA/OmpV family)
LSWDDEGADEARKRRQEMLTTIDKAIAMVVIGGISIANSFGWTHISAEAAANINAGLAVLAPFAVWLIPNKAK